MPAGLFDGPAHLIRNAASDHTPQAAKSHRDRRSGMAKTKISGADLVWVFTEKLKSFGDCASTIAIGIIPTKDGWKALTSQKNLRAHPLCAKRIEQVQIELREIYVLTKD
jgi:hypothetical protein